MQTQTPIQIVRTALEGLFDTIGKNKAGNIVVRRGYFYTHGCNEDKYATEIQAALPEGFRVTNKWNHWATFRGGASTAQQSHWGCEIQCPPPAPSKTAQESEELNDYMENLGR